MGFWGAVPWKTVANVIPLIAETVFKSNCSGNAEKEKEINELKARIKTIDSEIGSLYKGLRIVAVGLCIVLLIAVAALTVGIVALCRTSCSM